jgi:hypothetical protein
MHRGGQIEMKEGNNAGTRSIFLHIPCSLPRTGCKIEMINFFAEVIHRCTPEAKPQPVAMFPRL